MYRWPCLKCVNLPLCGVPLYLLPYLLIAVRMKRLMIIMSIDLGLARTGLAICDKSETLAYPLKVISEKSRDALAKKISEQASESHVELIVIGFPKNMDGSIGNSAKGALNFEKILKNYTNTKTIFWDERQTTISAAMNLNEINVRGEKRKKIIDAVSAVIILESYLSYRKNSKLNPDLL